MVRTVEWLLGTKTYLGSFSYHLGDIWDTMNDVSYINLDTSLKITDYYKIFGVSRRGTLKTMPFGSSRWMGEIVGSKQTCISWYMRDLAIRVVAYGISINLVEHPSPNEYSPFMGDFSTATGIVTFIMMLLGQIQHWPGPDEDSEPTGYFQRPI
ncbi:hypothetical protein GUJ93_ZPchr0006g45832 [Zizania palustris]|uniref:ADP,ATP carrier protein n=1 Tax=Zizania palustris TaxID=103762 RepID=A0A8J5SN83_ZIZPA|nr:hypothetical protein GUJ93_ZPchr0006g45832 [Zizania palustris]